MILLGGASVGTEKGGPGTLGAVFRCASRVGLFGLTSSHVASREGDTLYTPAPRDAGAGLEIGEVVAIDYTQGASLVAIGVPAAAYEIRGLPRIRGILSEEALREAVREEAPLAKTGHATGVTRGWLTHVDRDGVLTISGDDEDDEIAAGGDSGAIWVTLDGLAAGLHFCRAAGIRPGAAEALPMFAIAASLGLFVPPAPR